MIHRNFSATIVRELGDLLAASIDGLELRARLGEFFQSGNEPKEDEEFEQRFVVVGCDRRRCLSRSTASR